MARGTAPSKKADDTSEAPGGSPPGRLRAILRILGETYPDAHCELDFRTPLELLVATILSAQCTDARVNQVTASLFAKYRTAADYAGADPAVFENEIRSTGFFRNKAKSILACCAKLVREFGGAVPRTMEELVTLPGVGRKTANLVLTIGFGMPGICVDTHVHRISNRLGIVKTKTPEQTEFALRKVLPRRHWIPYNDLLVTFGQHVCKPISPLCSGCPVSDLCMRIGVGKHR